MKLSSNNFVACVGFAIMGLIGTVLAFDAKLLTPLGIMSHMKTVQATIAESGTQRTTTRSGMTITAYNFPYTFEVDGKEYRGNSAFDTLPGETETIQYDSRNPGLHHGPDLIGHAKIDLFIFCIPVFALVASLTALLIHRFSQEAPVVTQRRRMVKPPVAP